VEDIVRDGYDVIAETYHGSRLAREEVNRTWLDELRPMLPSSGQVVDLGCGAGVPITRYFADHGYDVTGYDLSGEMLRLARENVPSARFEQASMLDLEFPDESIDLILSFFAIIHVDRSLHEGLFRRMFRWLRPEGAILVSLGAGDNPAQKDENWHGAPMTWSHFDAETNLGLLRGVGFHIAWSEVEEFAPNERHLFVLAQKPSRSV
jgi:ubiquinone/menaquinone biosynthesis C-methylase UbiE